MGALMPVPPVTVIEETLGDTWRITLVFVDENGVAESHAGATWRGNVRTSKTAVSAFASFTWDTSSQASGIVVGTIAAATTAGATVDTAYHFDVEETTSGGDVVTHMQGTVTWRQDVSRA